MSAKHLDHGGAWPPDPATIDLSSPDWLTVKQAAGVLRVSENTMRKHTKTHDFHVRVGGRLWISHKRMMEVMLR